MKNILVISDNDLLNELYKINLEIYIGAQVTILKDSVSVQKSFENFRQFDLIISMATLSEHDMGSMCALALKNMNLSIPLLLIGKPSKELTNVIIIPSSYNLQNLLRKVASELGVTARAMVEVLVPKYYPVSVVYLRHLAHTPCTLFLQVKVSKTQNDYIICSTKDSLITNLISKLQSEGVMDLFVNSLDRLSLVNKISFELTLLISGMNGASTAVKSDALSVGFSFAASQMMDNAEVVQELVGIAATCSKVMDAVVSEVTGMKALVQMLINNQEGYIYTHSMLIAYVAKHIIKNVTWGGETHIERINFMIFFHDIFLVPIYDSHPDLRTEEDLLFGDALTEGEKNILLNHARLSGEQITKFKKCPPGVDVLIKQHHGMSNGIGFATDYSDNISPLSKLFIVAEAFTDYYLNEKYKNNNFKINLKECVELLNSRFSKHTYRKIIEPLLTLKI
jgi:response regulator RpfG family c-di-GMP phosphodiesterase